MRPCVAPVNGTIIDKPVSLGQVIASATGSVSGGTTLLKMADLTKVRVRALVNETDIGNVQRGADGPRDGRCLSRPSVPGLGGEDRAAGRGVSRA